MYGAGWEVVGSKDLHLLLFVFVDRFSFSSVFSMAFFNLFFHCGFFIFRMFSREQSSPMLVSWCMVFPGKLCCWRTCWVMLLKLMGELGACGGTYLSSVGSCFWWKGLLAHSWGQQMEWIWGTSTGVWVMSAVLFPSQQGPVKISDSRLRCEYYCWVIAFNSAVTPVIPFFLWAIVSFSFPSLVKISPRYL